MGGQHGLAGAHHGAGGQRSQLGGQGIHGGVERVVGHAFPNQPPLGRLGGGQFLRGQGQAHGARQPQALWHGPRCAGVGYQPDFGKRQHERSGLSRHHHVARQCQAATRTGGHALHTGDGGHTQVGQAHHQGFEVALDHVADVGRGLTGGEHHVGVGQVLTRTEAAPCARNHQHAHTCAIALACLQGIERVAQFGMHVAGEGVHFVGAIEREAGDARRRIG